MRCTLTRETFERKDDTDRSAPALGKCLAFLAFKELVMGRVHRLLGTSMKANIFLREDVLNAYDRAVGDTEVRSSQPDEWQVTSASWAHLTVENYERRVKD